MSNQVSSLKKSLESEQSLNDLEELQTDVSVLEARAKSLNRRIRVWQIVTGISAVLIVVVSISLGIS